MKKMGFKMINLIFLIIFFILTLCGIYVIYILNDENSKLHQFIKSNQYMSFKLYKYGVYFGTVIMAYASIKNFLILVNLL